MKSDNGINNVTGVIHNKLSLKEKISYGAGDFASNLMWGVIGSFLLYFYTDVALIPVAATGTIFLVSRVLDAFIDPVIGGFIDRTNTKWGRTKPYIMFGIIPLCIFLVLSFTTIGGSNTAKIVYAYVTYIIVGILYSTVNIPYGSLMTLMTRDTDEKSQLSSFRLFGMAVGSILVTASTMPLVNYFGNGNQQKGFVFTVTLFAIIGFITFMIITKNCKERYVEVIEVSREKTSIMDTYKNALKNTPWVIVVIFSFLAFLRVGAVIAITIFFCLQVLKNPAMIPVLLPGLYIAMIACAIIAPSFLKKFKHRNGNIISLCIYIAGYCIMPFVVSNQTIFIAIYFIANVFGGLCTASVFGMTADSVDYNEWKFGKRTEGTLYAGYSFATKVGMAFGGAVVGYVLALGGYDAQHITESSVQAINVVYYLVPIIFSVLQIIVISFYKLDKLHPQIVTELSDRRSE